MRDGYIANAYGPNPSRPVSRPGSGPTRLGYHPARVLPGPGPGPARGPPGACLLHIAYCLSPIACYLLPIAYCLLPIACCLVPIAYCHLLIACRLWPIAYCLLPNALCGLSAAVTGSGAFRRGLRGMGGWGGRAQGGNPLWVYFDIGHRILDIYFVNIIIVS